MDLEARETSSARVRLCRALLAIALILPAFALLQCAGRPPAGAGAPDGQLAREVRPLHYELELEILPALETFGGRVAIEVELDRALDRIWLHARDLDVNDVRVWTGEGAKVAARWEAAPPGLAAVVLERAVGPGKATIEVRYRAPFASGLEGLYRTEVGGDAYAFTQMEPIAARRAFPSFDEPSFKASFDVTLVIAANEVGIANTRLLEETPVGPGRKALRFATTEPLPTYLIAWAVGPFDVVDGEPIASSGGAIPFRGVAVRGRGRELAHALATTGPILRNLEGYFGSPYPFDKLDVIAVPDFRFGAMENAGAVTFRESLLLIDDAFAPETQIRRYTNVMAHELAHMWFGDLVTMRWWDDIWLNESFATWMASRVVRELYPEHGSELEHVKAVEWAMTSDSLRSSRRIRQPIASDHDIANAFDPISYEKGSSVLTMFERLLGEDAFRAGIRRYLAEHRFGSGDSGDLLDALSTAAGSDVAGPFSTFLEQPGVPLVQGDLVCDGRGGRLEFAQERYLPLGSPRPGAQEPDGVWSVPVCFRYSLGGEEREECTLLTSAADRVLLQGCPRWWMPHAAAAGYYRWAIPPAQLEVLAHTGWASLTPSERLSFVMNLTAGFRRGAVTGAVALNASAPAASDASRPVATAPIGLLRFAEDHAVDTATRPALRRWVAELYRPRLESLGWDAVPGESGEAALFRSEVVGVMLEVARDPATRAEAARRGRAALGLSAGGVLDRGVVGPDLLAAVLREAVQAGDVVEFEAALAHFHASDDAIVRRVLLSALSATFDPVLAERARRLGFDRRLLVNEAMTPLWVQSSQRENRDAAWRYVEEHFDAIVERISVENAGDLPWMASGFCSNERADAVAAFFSDRIQALAGGPRNLASALEQIRICAAVAGAQTESIRSAMRER